MERGSEREVGIEVAWAGTSDFRDVEIRGLRVRRGPLPRRGWAIPLFVDRHRHVPATGVPEGASVDLDLRDAEVRRLRADAFTGRIVDMGVGVLAPWPNRPTWVDSALRGLTGSGAAIHQRRYAKQVVSGGSARQAVLEHARAGASHVKVIATGSGLAPPAEAVRPIIDRRTFDEVTDAARDAGLPVAVHSHGGATVEWCIENRVSTLEHGLYLDDQQLLDLHRAGIGLTLTPGAYITASPGSMGPVMTSLVRRALDAGIELGVGTDGETETMDRQLALLVELGMPFSLAAAASTEGPAPSEPPDGTSPFIVFDDDPSASPAVLGDPLGVYDPQCLVGSAGA